MQTRFLTGDTKGYNVIAELPGTDLALKDEVVLLGAHLDSWHTGTGATDNADGSAAVMEAMRILKTVRAPPKRTVRVALWGGEEEGLLGARAYVTAHHAGDANKAARERVVEYLNIDPGMGPIYGWYAEGSAPSKAILDTWTAPLKDLGSGATSTRALAAPTMSPSARPASQGSTRCRITSPTMSHASHERGHA